MSSKTAIITGTSSGFGLLCAIELAKHGFQVIATMRNTSNAGPLLSSAKKQNVLENIHTYPLDVTSTESINHLTTYLSHFHTIDVLVNNAGFALGGFSEELTVEDYRKQFETNFFGVIAITNAILPFMRAQGQGRIINMSSISGKIGFPGLSPYVSSKHALEGYSESLRLELKPFGIDVVLIEPGSYKTNIWSSIDSTNLNSDSPYYSYMGAILKEIGTGMTEHGDPQDVANLVAEIATLQKTPDLRYPIGKDVKKNLFLKKVLKWKLIEEAILKKLLR
ncbi:SDR family oxidoreductase [Bacillus sp. 1NLA3E]|uniref:SDR family oxidoreductase n=1 Tax=Bacillus sp. 1NLA3E TaxID=666686 RepID=UPI000247F46E|nr:SDR family oxidoreductase [Bacillus sp. 1NLA3E]AGK53778.1 short chain dehydrogenase [Bacillus sp. 1NLA3E]